MTTVCVIIPVTSNIASRVVDEPAITENRNITQLQNLTGSKKTDHNLEKARDHTLPPASYSNTLIYIPCPA